MADQHLQMPSMISILRTKSYLQYIGKSTKFARNKRRNENNPVAGFSGDGGPAINAQLGGPSSLCFDVTGNLYFVDGVNRRIRKVAAGTGIITTVAGNGGYGVGGDGGPALSAQISADVIAIDISGNIYLGGQNYYRIRKIIASTGLINTIAGTGVKGYNGEGLPALSAQINDDVGSIYADAAGNIYFGESRNPRVRKIATDGKIYTVAGTGISADAGDGPHATAYDISGPNSIVLDSQGNILFSANFRIRKVNGN
jgi:sugar lactone lactonase YvrE